MGLGNVFGGSFGDILRTALPVVGGLVGSVIPGFGTIAGGAIGGIAGQLLAGAPDIPMGPVGGVTPTGFFPGGERVTIGGGGMPAFFDPTPAIPVNGEVTPVAAGAAVPVIMGLTRTLALTISRLASRLGITILGVAGLSRVGSRIWRSLVAFTRRHPNISVLGLLTSLGLTIEEASEFIAWGSTRRRRRRGGISTRDMRIARRTIRRISSFQQDLGGLRRGPRRGLRVPPGTSIVRAG